MVFCLPLVIGIAAIYLTEKADSELAYLTTVVAAVSLIISLVLLPWQLKGLLLVLVWFLARRPLTSVTRLDGSISQPVSAELSPERSQTEPLTATEPERELVGKYRGATWRATQVVETSAERAPLKDLKYRGATFWNASPRF